MERWKLTHSYDDAMEPGKWRKEIPFIEFPAGWKVQISPPSGGAVVRFRVKKDKAEMSVYLDCYDSIGRYGSPYWEIYPYNDEASTYRCGIKETEKLLGVIEESIQRQNLVNITPEMNLIEDKTEKERE